MDPKTGVTLLLVGYLIFMAVMFYLVLWVLPVRRNMRRFCVKELRERGGSITISGKTIRVKPMASIEIGANSITIHQDGNPIRLTFNWRTPITVEVF